MTAAKLIDGMVGPDLEVNPDFVDVLLQSASFDGCIQLKSDRPNCLSENGGLTCWVIDLTYCWTFPRCCADAIVASNVIC